MLGHKSEADGWPRESMVIHTNPPPPTYGPLRGMGKIAFIVKVKLSILCTFRNVCVWLRVKERERKTARKEEWEITKKIWLRTKSNNLPMRKTWLRASAARRPSPSPTWMRPLPLPEEIVAPPSSRTFLLSAGSRKSSLGRPFARDICPETQMWCWAWGWLKGCRPALRNTRPGRRHLFRMC